MVDEVKFEGFCHGGPYNGQWAWHNERHCTVAYDMVSSVIRYGTYRFNLGKWIWRPDDAAYPGQA